MNGALILAVPSKGRLQENAESFFARSGLELVKRQDASAEHVCEPSTVGC